MLSTNALPHRAALIALALAAGALPARAADAAHGETLAKRWCASCHLVSADQTKASADVPSFRMLAERKSAPPIEAFLSAPHPQMPDMSLTRAEIADLAAYIRAQTP